MENATKALLIAGGVLLALLIISTLIFGYNKMVEYQNSDEEAKIQQELADFNAEYATYLRQDVTGFELVSLINKVMDYNHMIGSNWSESKTKYTPMNINFTLTDTNAFPGPSKNADYLFKTGTLYTFGDVKDSSKVSSKKTSEKLQTIMDNMAKLEKDYNASIMSKLAANIYSPSLQNVSGDQGSQTWKEGIDLLLKHQLSNNASKYPSRKNIKQYEEYISFKRSKFKYTNVTYENGKNQSGRITSISFEEI